MLLIGVFRMAFLHSKPSRIACALFALFVISADLMADAMHDATDACMTESQSGGCDSCPACSGCAIHTATALMDSAVIVIVADEGAGAPVPEESDQWAVGLASAIDHPPQLA
jgi:hypothetical protein